MTSLLQGSRQDSPLESRAWPAVRTCVIGPPGITVVVRTRGFFWPCACIRREHERALLHSFAV